MRPWVWAFSVEWVGRALRQQPRPRSTLCERIDVAERTCPGCGAAIVPHTRERNKRRWCSEACRQWHYRHPGEVRPIENRCRFCSSELAGRRVTTKYCSSSCAYKANRGPLPEMDCPECGVRFTRTTTRQATCGASACTSRHWRRLNPEKAAAGRRSDATKAGWQKRRARKRGAFAETVRPIDVFERDRWRCQLCGKRVDPDLSYPEPLSKSLDHIVPLADGGTHSMANLQLTHLECNIRKGTRPQGEQLRLIG